MPYLPALCMQSPSTRSIISSKFQHPHPKSHSLTSGGRPWARTSSVFCGGAEEGQPCVGQTLLQFCTEAAAAATAHQDMHSPARASGLMSRFMTPRRWQ